MNFIISKDCYLLKCYLLSATCYLVLESALDCKELKTGIRHPGTTGAKKVSFVDKKTQKMSGTLSNTEGKQSTEKKNK